MTWYRLYCSQNKNFNSILKKVRDAKLSSEEYIDIFIEQLAHEDSDDIISNQFTYVKGSLASFTPRKYKTLLSDRLFQFTYDYLLKIPADKKNRILIAKDKLISFASS